MSCVNRSKSHSFGWTLYHHLEKSHGAVTKTFSPAEFQLVWLVVPTEPVSERREPRWPRLEDANLGLGAGLVLKLTFAFFSLSLEMCSCCCWHVDGFIVTHGRQKTHLISALPPCLPSSVREARLTSPICTAAIPVCNGGSPGNPAQIPHLFRWYSEIYAGIVQWCNRSR